MREVKPERLVKDAKRVLENPFWIPELDTKEYYSRLHDDHDGTFIGTVGVTFSPDGDAWVNIRSEPVGSSLRFRTFAGGGMSLRTRTALMILAYTIKLDNEERPQPKGDEENGM